ncbi:MAG: hypothetical protein KDD61_14620 [Bdellovibrionales bacterium]|nr:hypothetical protein [Bdellovibrionales bacterium]
MSKYILVFTILIAGCATSYQKEGLSGGYSDIEVGKNKFLVTFSGNGYTGRSRVQQFAFQRAKELCVEKGFKSFELVNRDDQTSHTPNSNGYIVSRSRAEIVITCVN